MKVKYRQVQLKTEKTVSDMLIFKQIFLIFAYKCGILNYIPEKTLCDTFDLRKFSVLF